LSQPEAGMSDNGAAWIDWAKGWLWVLPVTAFEGAAGHKGPFHGLDALRNGFSCNGFAESTESR
jgi:hypothetical protein